MNLVLCDDHAVVMQSMAAMFRAHGHTPVATVAHPQELVEVVDHLRPDVCVTDLLFDDDRPDMVFETITQLSVLVDVVVVSGAGHLTSRAMEAGAVAVASKALSAPHLCALVEGRRASGGVGGLSVGGAVDLPTLPTSSPHLLTGREMQVLEGLSHGDSTIRIADRLGIQPATAQSYVQGVLMKLGVSSRTAAVAVAVQRGVVDLPA